MIGAAPKMAQKCSPFRHAPLFSPHVKPLFLDRGRAMPYYDDYRDFELAVRAGLERFVAKHFPREGITVYGSRVYSGKSGNHQIDVSAEGTLGGIRILIVGECKHYARNVGTRPAAA